MIRYLATGSGIVEKENNSPAVQTRSCQSLAEHCLQVTIRLPTFSASLSYLYYN
jgi:hypothetical protein